MTGQDSLVEQAAKVIAGMDWLTSMHLEKARAVLSLFEKAHTPTDDEREALIDALLDTDFVSGYDWVGTGTSYPTNEEIREEIGELADVLLRFRRTEERQGEPSDAQVDRALEEYARVSGGRVYENAMRAALRAAGAVR